MTATTSMKSKDKTGNIQLSSHDVNVISAVVQQKAVLPRDFLLVHAKEAQISNDALEIIKLLLDESFDPKQLTAVTTKKAAKKKIASVFYQWAHR